MMTKDRFVDIIFVKETEEIDKKLETAANKLAKDLYAQGCSHEDYTAAILVIEYPASYIQGSFLSRLVSIYEGRGFNMKITQYASNQSSVFLEFYLC